MGFPLVATPSCGRGSGIRICGRRQLLHELCRFRKVLRSYRRLPKDNVQLELAMEHSGHYTAQTRSSQARDDQTSKSQKEVCAIAEKGLISLHMCKTTTHRFKASSSTTC